MNSRTHRRAQLAIRAATMRDVLRLWPAFDLTRISRTWPAFESAMVALIRERGRISSGVAYAYYRTAREEADVAGGPPPMRSTPTLEEILAGLRWAGTVNTARQLALNRRIEDVAATALVNVSGVATKYVLDHGRDTLLHAVQDDPGAQGWKRETSGAACGFCSTLAGRGAVYKSETTAEFASHRHCVCTAVPVW